MKKAFLLLLICTTIVSASFHSRASSCKEILKVQSQKILHLAFIDGILVLVAPPLALAGIGATLDTGISADNLNTLIDQAYVGEGNMLRNSYKKVERRQHKAGRQEALSFDQFVAAIKQGNEDGSLCPNKNFSRKSKALKILTQIQSENQENCAEQQ